MSYNDLKISFRGNVSDGTDSVWQMGKRYDIKFVSKDPDNSDSLRVEVESEDKDKGSVIIMDKGVEESIWTGFLPDKGRKVSYDIWSMGSKVHWEYLRSLIL